MWTVCVDFGSTFTKAALVDTDAGELLATTQHRTTLPGPGGGGDVLDGYDACLAALEAEHPGAKDARALACSSAGGGLRIAVLGNESLVTAEAGRRVALSSGGKVVAVLSADRAPGELAATIATDRPDVVLLTGGTDGGDSEAVVAGAADLVAAGWRGPVVVAGNVQAQAQVAALLVDVPHVVADNVVPRIGVLAPESARRAIREVFLSHVIGGKHLSSRTTGAGQDFTSMVLGATPDVVLTGVELLAGEVGSTTPGAGVVVVDIGGATTDVHSVVVLDPEEAELSREVVAVTPVTRTVEGDLGMRWSAATTAAAAAEAGLDVPPDAVRRAADPAYLPADAEERAGDEALARVAATIAMRRHVGRSRVVLSPQGRVVERTGKDLRAVGLLVGSGGVLRAADPATAARILGAATGRDPEGWQLPEDPRIVVDADYVLAAAGLIALSGGGGGDAAREQARRLVCNSLSRWR
jgi:uncharacterized protein (TIGR01319 family)